MKLDPVLLTPPVLRCARQRESQSHRSCPRAWDEVILPKQSGMQGHNWGLVVFERTTEQSGLVVLKEELLDTWQSDH